MRGEGVMDNWDEIRTAYQVARMGTVSGAAEVLGVHHATVIRHIDALEAALGAKLFQRHARGYTATEAGQDLLSVAGVADDQFTQLAGRIKGRGDEVTGDLIVTSLGSLSPLLVPTIAKFQERHPDLRVRLISDARLFRLEYGEAHVAIRAGKLPDQPDNVVQPFFTQTLRLVASAAYVEKHGPLTDETLESHRFVGPERGDAARALLPLADRDGARGQHRVPRLGHARGEGGGDRGDRASASSRGGTATGPRTWSTCCRRWRSGRPRSGSSRIWTCIARPRCRASCAT
jgi:DNA-binding transcriptional LysR family regulator